MTLQELCIAQARTWLGTRYRHQGRQKKSAYHHGGVDCLGLLMGVAGELQLNDQHGMPFVDNDHIIYSKQPDTEFMCACLMRAMRPIRLEDMGVSDVLLFAIDGRAQHLAMCSDGAAWGRETLGIIHAYAPARKVVEHRLDSAWMARISACFRLIDEEVNSIS